MNKPKAIAIDLIRIERLVELYSNPGENVLTPFMGVGSEVYGAVTLGRRGIGCELKPSYYAQAVTNLAELNKAKSQPITAGMLDLQFDDNLVDSK